MNTSLHPLAGVYAAAVTPLRADGAPDHDGVLRLLDFLARRGCHGALLFGTTGEGPSFSLEERLGVMRAALAIRQDHPNFRLFVGAGTPSLTETVNITRTAFALGYDATVILPPYYYRKVNDEGLFAWFSEVIHKAAPADGTVLGYHIPPVTGIPFSLDLLERLKYTFPRQFAGIKDSSAEPEHARRLGERFGAELLVFNGSDRLLTLALQSHAAGCITALANVCSPDLRLVWEAYFRGEIDIRAQSRLNTARDVLENFPPAPPLLKALLHHRYGLPFWPVRAPLCQVTANLVAHALAEMEWSGD